ncbi:MAG: hypothetical protein V2I67_11535 [Thermoanaerobaculales bacterium]|nr:hypothetical protein [Thermoanaerobaculales bacterium]
MKQLSVRNVTPDIAAALERERQLRGTSLNATVLDLLRRALGLGAENHDNGLASLAGTWTEDEHAEFEQAVSCFEEIEPEAWR